MAGKSALNQGQMNTNAMLGLAPTAKTPYPAPTTRRKRFAKIRDVIKGQK